MEIWKPVRGYEGSYFISNLGRVRSVKDCFKKRDRILRPRKIARGRYLAVTLTPGPEGKRCKEMQVHRMVAEAFIPNPRQKPFVDHKNCDTFDNRVENLQWVTPQENVMRAVVLGHMEHLRTNWIGRKRNAKGQLC